MRSEFISYEIEGEIALIGLRRPDKRNAMHGALFEELTHAVGRAGEEAKVGVLFGHGDQFSAGLDLAYAASGFGGMDPLERRRRPDPTRLPFGEVARGPIPFVAALHGAVVGAGFELAASAHIRVADETAFFALPEGKRGIFVGGGGSVRIQRLIGYGRMADMMLTGRLYDAQQAERIDAVQYVVPPGEALEKAKAVARRVAENAILSNWAVTNALPRLGSLSDEE
ncbi:MAG TPA: crotonase/enoyl-CoA hydratase family protein, partial [Phenylobacterium sp.]|nr:crotonase/enoyl-CoA hydratase family protein [Phenylobacterium sp.]